MARFGRMVSWLKFVSVFVFRKYSKFGTFETKLHGLVILLPIDRPTYVLNASNRSHVAVVGGRHSSWLSSSSLFRFREVVGHAEEGAIVISL